jgi:hypothetical protein
MLFGLANAGQPTMPRARTAGSLEVGFPGEKRRMQAHRRLTITPTTLRFQPRNTSLLREPPAGSKSALDSFGNLNTGQGPYMRFASPRQTVQIVTALKHGNQASLATA